MAGWSAAWRPPSLDLSESGIKVLDDGAVVMELEHEQGDDVEISEDGDDRFRRLLEECLTSSLTLWE